MGIGEPSFSSSQPLSISFSRWLWVEILDLLNHIFPIKLKLESKKPTEPGNVLTILNFRGGNMGTGEPSLSYSQPLSFLSSRWLWVEVSDLLCFLYFFCIFVISILILSCRSTISLCFVYCEFWAWFSTNKHF